MSSVCSVWGRSLDQTSKPIESLYHGYTSDPLTPGRAHYAHAHTHQHQTPSCRIYSECIMSYTSLIPPILCRNVLLHDAPHLQPFPLFLRCLFLLVHLEMGNVLRMVQILLFDIIPAVILFKMMDFILILVVAMMSRPHTKIGQLCALLVFAKEFGERDGAVLVDVEHVKDGLDNGSFLALGDGGRGDVFEAVSAADILGRPEPRALVVVQIEEGRCVEAGKVMLLCIAVSVYLALYQGYMALCRVFIPAICRVAQSASGATSTCGCSVAPPCADTLSAHDSSKNALIGALVILFIFDLRLKSHSSVLLSCASCGDE
ncbi:hypothetical protein IAQ61_003813 [Plenodomus lingam]|uniref:uncharacterized protein n=1 Tax=Leptosphaeria maculans TaxID=5022 RepID=UPI0033294AEF|nr:hypothetical protein IAQ61_003813 [Plenodomus lingam]